MCLLFPDSQLALLLELDQLTFRVGLAPRLLRPKLGPEPTAPQGSPVPCFGRPRAHFVNAYPLALYGERVETFEIATVLLFLRNKLGRPGSFVGRLVLQFEVLVSVEVSAELFFGVLGSVGC